MFLPEHFDNNFSVILSKFRRYPLFAHTIRLIFCNGDDSIVKPSFLASRAAVSFAHIFLVGRLFGGFD